MQYKHLGRSGLNVSRLALGTMNFGMVTDEAAAVTAAIVGPRTRDQLTASQRALDVSLSDDTLRRLDEIWTGPGGQAPQAYAW